jgi:hypothetical protein
MVSTVSWNNAVVHAALNRDLNSSPQTSSFSTFSAEIHVYCVTKFVWDSICDLFRDGFNLITLEVLLCDQKVINFSMGSYDKTSKVDFLRKSDQFLFSMVQSFLVIV